MKWNVIDTLSQYENMFAMTSDRQEDYYRYTMMGPFEPMWRMMNAPLRAKAPGGYDVLMASGLLGCLHVSQLEIGQVGLERLKEIQFLALAEKTLAHCMEHTTKAGLQINAEALHFGAFLGDPQKLAYTKGYTGFGGIPGYILLIVYPNAYNIPRIQAAITHEFHHNIRFSYFGWNHGHVTVGEYLVIEGLADLFACTLYGEETAGPWITEFDPNELDYSVEVIGQALDAKGFDVISSYMFGDAIAQERGYQPVGLSYAAGYAVGYHTVQAFLKHTGASIYEATRLSATEIIQGSRIFG